MYFLGYLQKILQLDSIVGCMRTIPSQIQIRYAIFLENSSLNYENEKSTYWELRFVGTQKKLEAIELLAKNKGDSNNPTFLREELSRTLYMLANESIEKERVKKKNDTIEKIRQAQKKRETALKT